MMAYTNITLYVPMAMLGFAFTLVPAIIWPSVAYLVAQRTLGTALGLMTMVQNHGTDRDELGAGQGQRRGRSQRDQSRGLSCRC